VLGHSRDRANIGHAAQGVNERVVAEGVRRGVEPYGPGVDGGHGGDDEFDLCAVHQFAQRQIPQFLPGGELVQPYPFDEPVLGVDEGDADVGSA
jgi:hypothetical protein